MTDDVHGVREAGLAQLTGALTDLERALDYEDREFEIYRRADLVLTVSEADKSHIEFAGEKSTIKVRAWPMAADLAPRSPAFHERTGFLYLGDFQNPANRLSLSTLTHEVWPVIRAQLRGGDSLPGRQPRPKGAR